MGPVWTPIDASGAGLTMPCGGNTTLWAQIQAGTTTAYLWTTAAQTVRRVNSGISTISINGTLI